MPVPVPPVVDPLPLGDEVELDADVGLDDEIELDDDVELDDEVGLEDDVGIDDEEDSDEDEEDSDDDVEFMDEDQDVPPLPPSPVFSDVTYESDTSEALGYALETEVPTTYEVGESSTAARVTQSEVSGELSRLRQDLTRCQGRYVSLARSTCFRPCEIGDLTKEIVGEQKAADKMHVGLHRHAARLVSAEQSDARVQERLDLLDERMTEMSRMVEQLTMREAFLDIDSRRHYRSIQSLWDELHATQRQVYYDRMASFRPSDSIDVMAVYGGRREGSD